MTNYQSGPDSTGMGTGLFTPERKMAAAVYLLYLASIIIGITSIVGVIVAYVYHGDADEVLRTHYRFQIRTFWISLLIGFIGILLAGIGIGFLLLLFLLIWFVARCAIGLKHLNEGMPVPNPGSWLFGTK